MLLGIKYFLTYIRLHKLCQLNHIVFCFKKNLKSKKTKTKTTGL